MKWHRVILILFFGVYLSEEADRVKTDNDSVGGGFFANLGEKINQMLNSLLGTHPTNDAQSQRSSLDIQPRIQDNPQQAPALRKRTFDRHSPSANIAPTPQVPTQQDTGEQQIRVIDQNGKLSYCNDNPADCSYLACLAENFQHSQQASNLRMAGKVFIDRNLRRAVAHDPLISQAACDRVGLGQQGCQGFREILGIVDRLDPTPDDGQNTDPERNSGRRKRDKVDYDYDHIDPQPNSRASLGVNGRQQIGRNRNRNQGAQTGLMVGPTSANNANHTPDPAAPVEEHGGKVPDYSEYYESGGAHSKGGGTGTPETYKPKDCKVIVRNANRRGR